MPITETIKKGQIKRKVSASEVEILRPETEAELVIYDNTDSGLTATDTQAAIDEVAAAVVQAGKVDDVKIQVDAGTATTIVSNKIATIPVTSSYSGTSETIVNGKAIKAAIDGLDVSEFNLTETDTTTNVVTLHGIKEADGKIAVGTTAANNVTFYNKTGADNAISAAINALDTSTDVRIAPVDSGIISFKDIKEVNGIISASSTDTGIQTYTKGTLDTKFGDKLDKLTTNGNKVYAHQGATQTEYGVDSGSSPNYIVQRDANGQVIVPLTPTDNSHAASKKYVDDKITSGVEYLGIVNNTTELYALDSSAGEGDWVRVGTEFTYSSETCHVGDILICSAAKGSADHATWDVLHTEVDTDTNTKYQALVAAGGTGYAGAIKLQAKELGGSWADQDTIKFINDKGITITPDTTNKTLKIEHSNNITADTTAKVRKTKVDAQGHITNYDQAYANDVGVSLGTTPTSGVTSNATVIKVQNTSSDTKEVHVATTDTDQNIGGSKTFTAPIKLEGTTSGTGTLLTSTGSDGSFGFKQYTSSSESEIFSYNYTSGILHFVDSAAEGYLRFPWVGTSSTPKTLATTDDLTGFVTGPVSNTENALALFNGTTGKVLKDSGVYYRGTNPASGSVFQVHGGTADFHYVGNGSRPAIYVAGGTAGDLGTSSNKWHDLHLSNNLTDGTNSTTIASIVAGLTTNVYSGKKSDGTTDITGSKDGTIITLGNSGITAGTYSAIQVNAKGIAVAGGQILDVIAHGGTPNVVNGGWYFEELATA